MVVLLHKYKNSDIRGLESDLKWYQEHHSIVPAMHRSSRNMGRMSPMPFTAESVADGRKNEGSAWSSSLYRLCSNNENPEEACKGCVAHRKAWNNGIQ